MGCFVQYLLACLILPGLGLVIARLVTGETEVFSWFGLGFAYAFGWVSITVGSIGYSLTKPEPDPCANCFDCC